MTTTTIGVGGEGVGGSAMGGSGGEDLGPCGQDCSAIPTMPCFKAVCNEGAFPGPIFDCVVVPEDEGVACDDGLFCTVEDACDGAGTCAGGEANDCGMQAGDCEQVVCDEDDQVCTTEATPNGDPCAAGNLCITGSTCLNGLCQGGNVEDCFLQPVPNDCYVSVCNPMNGMCEPLIGNDGQTCTDLNDLCTVDKTCNNGACVGGNPKDCSSAAAECEVGVCDMATGNCTGAPGMSGDACTGAADECNAGTCDMSGMCQPVPLASGTVCPSAADECNTGACDASGSCQPVPTPNVACSSAADQCNAGLCDATGTCQAQALADGTTCNDFDSCTANDSCTTGICGGSAITACTGGDGCCPSGCDATTDIDCAICSVDFDDGTLQGWTVTGNGGSVTWQPDTFKFQAGTHSLYYGDPIARNYDSGLANQGTATSKVINLQPGNPQVTFYVQSLVEASGSFDQFNLWVMPANQQVWDKSDLASPGGTSTWTQQTVDLTAFAGQAIQLEFRFDTVDSIANGTEGVYVDTIVADGNCP